MRDEKLTDKSHRQSQIRKNADMSIPGDNGLLAIQKRKDHGHSNSGRIVEPMEERSGKENPFGHFLYRTTFSAR